jgi:hypothetical protein
VTFAIFRDMDLDLFKPFVSGAKFGMVVAVLTLLIIELERAIS